MAAVIGSVGRRLVEGTVGLFALLGFLYVPLGRHTGFEHARAVLGTPQATAALQDVTTAALRLRERVLQLFSGHFASQLPPPASEAVPTAGEKLERSPKPIPPKLN